MAKDEIQDHRLDGIENRLDNHDDLLKKMSEAQTEMMVSIAELNTQVSAVVTLLRKGGPLVIAGIGALVGIDLSGAI